MDSKKVNSIKDRAFATTYGICPCVKLGGHIFNKNIDLDINF